MRELEDIASDKWMKIKEEGRIKLLTQQNEFFKNEAFKLDRMCKIYQRKYKNMKKLYEITLTDKNLTESHLKANKKMNIGMYFRTLENNKVDERELISIMSKEHVDSSEMSCSDRQLAIEDNESKQETDNQDMGSLRKQHSSQYK